MPLVDVEHARNAPLITDLLGRCVARNVLMACEESMPGGAEALLIRTACLKSEYVANYNDCRGSIRAFTHIREKLDGTSRTQRVGQISPIKIPNVSRFRLSFLIPANAAAEAASSRQSTPCNHYPRRGRSQSGVSAQRPAWRKYPARPQRQCV